jgi:phage shock protein PspC (stress-responsive transcriptional regulator)
MSIPQPAPRPQQPKRLVRRTDDRMVAGVCSGVADYFGVDVTLVRLVTVVGAIFGFGSLILAYVVAWALLPRSEARRGRMGT